MDKQKIINNLPKTYIDNSKIHGKGLFALEIIKSNEILGYLDGQIISWEIYDEFIHTIKKLNNEEFDNFVFYDEWNALPNEKVMIRLFRTKYAFINHSRTPNIQIKYNPLRIVALKDILKGEELLIDYRKEQLREEYINGAGKQFL
jgi:SET domain-containing protein